jgi:hypothetical protein
LHGEPTVKVTLDSSGVMEVGATGAAVLQAVNTSAATATKARLDLRQLNRVVRDIKSVLIRTWRGANPALVRPR